MDETYDGIILGAGHNGMIAQAYLCKAGLKVLSIDRRPLFGGGLTTEEEPEFPGYLHNTHAVFCRAVTSLAWYRDLELERHGLTMIEPEMNVALMTRDHDVLQWWTDFEKTYESVARFSRNDADTLRRWYEEFVPIVQKILRPELASPPLPAERRRALLSRTKAGQRVLEVAQLSPLEFVQREFEHPVVQAGLIFFNGLREVDMRVKGFGHHIAMLLASPAKAQMPKGGTARLAKAIAAAVREAGGDIMLNTEIRRIVVENGRAAGIETMDGRTIRARKFVASSLNPAQTFLEFLDPEVVPEAWQEKARGFKFNLVAPLMSLHLKLKAPPDYLAARKVPSANDCFMVIMGIDDLQTFQTMFECHERGIMPPGPILYGSCLTRHDPTQAPPGKHTAFVWQKVPYHLYGNPDNWDRYKDEVGRQMLDQWIHYAPNLATDVERWFTRSPRDTARELPNLGEGDTLGGAFTNGQYFDGRPFAGAGNYRTHLDGLYVCGSASHPGGNVTGLPGYNAAQIVLADLGVETNWFPPTMDKQLEALA
ncbi:NAD(P)/FAD-dependent oxidoreductase [Mesorhizobium sp. WSM2239]|uniref:Pyridine nucleotide-disulfide oxidoreductase domain-containing protein 2 n=2 Tax=unclassified Mesorhizobium TaxID=325217 RepID=A0AAU8DK77_9HYPH